MMGLEVPEASIFGTASESFKLSVAWYGSEIECGTLAKEAPAKIFPGGTSEAILKLSACQVHTEAKSLEVGEEEAEIDNETGGHVILGPIEEEAAATFAAHLFG